MLKNVRKRILDATLFRGYFERKRLEKEARLRDLETERERIVNAMDANLAHGEEISRRLLSFEEDEHPSATLRRQQWFRVKQRMAQQAWDEVADENVRLRVLDDYILDVNENSLSWQYFHDGLKEEILSWIEGANSVTADLHAYMIELNLERRRNRFPFCIRP